MAHSNEPSNNKWMTYLADNVLLDAEDQNAGSQFFWQGPEQVDCSGEVNTGNRAETTEDIGEHETQSAKKRPRDDSVKDPSGKANREKLRRDRLNDRFMELSQALDPERPPKTDKATILCDAVRVISQLRAEAEQLKEGNTSLKDQIKELKSEKNELRDEKSRLKTEKEKLEQQLKSMAVPPPGFMAHPAYAAAFAAQQAHAQGTMAGKMSGAIPTYSAMPPMWQWLPPNSVDTSQDHIRHPPVA